MLPEGALMRQSRTSGLADLPLLTRNHRKQGTGFVRVAPAVNASSPHHYATLPIY